MVILVCFDADVDIFVYALILFPRRTITKIALDSEAGGWQATFFSYKASFVMNL